MKQPSARLLHARLTLVVFRVRPRDKVQLLGVIHFYDGLAVSVPAGKAAQYHACAAVQLRVRHVDANGTATLYFGLLQLSQFITQLPLSCPPRGNTSRTDDNR